MILYDVTDPYEPRFSCYLPACQEGGLADCAPEGLAWVSGSESPTGQPMLVVCHEVSATVTAYALNLAPSPATAASLARILEKTTSEQ